MDMYTEQQQQQQQRKGKQEGIHLPPDTAAHRVPWTSLLRWDSPVGGAVASVGPWLVLALPVAAAFHALPVEPYMDEIFHVPQAQRYCGGDWSYWNPMITTLPGLYLSAIPVAKAATAALGGAGASGAGARTTGTPSGEYHDGGCSPSALRGTNLLYGAGCVLLLYGLRLRQEEEQESNATAGRAGTRQPPPLSPLSRRRHSRYLSAAAHALVLSLYPVHFFFTFLFYTDVGSVFWILLAVLLATAPPSATVASTSTAAASSSSSSSRRKRSRRSVLRKVGAVVACCAAILVRQTNVSWVLFVFGTTCLADLNQQSSSASSPSSSSTSSSSSSSSSFLAELWWFVGALVGDAPGLLWRHGFLLAPVAAFAYFVVALNGGSLVVGDHEHHESGLRNATPHFAQLAYLAVAAALPLLPLGGGGGGGGGGSCRKADASSSCSIFLVGRADLLELFAAGTGIDLGPPPPPPLPPADAVPAHDKGSQSTSSKSSSSQSQSQSQSSQSTRVMYALSRAVAAVAFVAHLLRGHSVEHPFLVADNRHFPFYVWRKVLNHPTRPWVKWALAPLYVAVAYLVAARLLGHVKSATTATAGEDGIADGATPLRPPKPGARAEGRAAKNKLATDSSSSSSSGSTTTTTTTTTTNISGVGGGGSGNGNGGGGSGVSRLWVLIWFVASALVLVPSPLLEPRYFTTAILVAHAHAPPRPSWKATAATGALFAAFNAAVLGLFLLCPFQWPDGSTARFMW